MTHVFLGFTMKKENVIVTKRSHCIVCGVKGGARQMRRYSVGFALLRSNGGLNLQEIDKFFVGEK